MTTKLNLFIPLTLLHLGMGGGGGGGRRGGRGDSHSNWSCSFGQPFGSRVAW